MPTTLHLSHYHRYLWQGPELIVVTGDATQLWQGCKHYGEQHQLAAEDNESRKALQRLFAAAGLAAVSLPERESWGWTLSLPDSTVGLFCAVEPEGMVCGTTRVSAPDGNAAAVQRQKEKSPLTQSHYTLTSSDPVNAVAQYFEESAQMLVRVAMLDDGRGTLVQPMPGYGFGPLDGLSDRALVERCFGAAQDGSATLLEEVLLFYECRCTDEMILNMITGLPADQRAALWQNAARLDINCPRCGRKYTVNKNHQAV